MIIFLSLHYSRPLPRGFSFYRINTSFIKTLDICEILFEKFLRIMTISFL